MVGLKYTAQGTIQAVLSTVGGYLKQLALNELTPTWIGQCATKMKLNQGGLEWWHQRKAAFLHHLRATWATS